MIIKPNLGANQNPLDLAKSIASAHPHQLESTATDFISARMRKALQGATGN